MKFFQSPLNCSFTYAEKNSYFSCAEPLLNQEFELFYRNIISGSARTASKHFYCLIHHIIVIQLETVEGFSHNGDNSFVNESNIKTPEYNFIQAVYSVLHMIQGVTGTLSRL